jgi:predicted flap endonuclease-1-like 5' DNA nuclease
MEANMFATILLEETGPNTELNWLLLLFLAFFFLMVIVGWWVSRGGSQPEVTPEMQVHHEAPAVHEVHDLHQEVTAPDDLVKLEGIGPKVARVLNEAGITTFAALAAANPVEIQKTLSAAGLQMMNPEGWIEQAALAARGDWTGLEKLQSELRGGRRR